LLPEPFAYNLRRSAEKTNVAAALLLVFGGLAIAADFLLVVTTGGEPSDWPLSTVFSAERMLPLIGLGLLLGQSTRRLKLPALVVVLGSAVLGTLLRERYFEWVAPVPGVAANLFLTGPIACIAFGIALIFPQRLRAFAAFPMLVVGSAALAVVTLLSDPTFHSRTYLPTAFVAQGWVVVAVSAVATILDRPWAALGTRIFGSWLVAIGLLYGGAHVAARQTIQPPPFPAPAGTGLYPGFDALLDDLDMTPPNPAVGKP